MSDTTTMPAPPKVDEHSVKIKIAASRVLEYKARDYIPEVAQEGESTDVQFGFNVKSTFGITGQLDRVIITLSISSFVDNNPDHQVCFIETEHVFEVEDFEQFKKEDQTVTLPPQVSSILIGVALGMARGILFAKNFGTSYSNVIVPLMSMEDLIPKEPFRMDGPSTEVRVKAH